MYGQLCYKTESEAITYLSHAISGIVTGVALATTATTLTAALATTATAIARSARALKIVSAVN